MLYLDRKTVNTEKAVEDYWPRGGISRSGVDRNPLRASKAKGRLLFKFLVKEIRKEL